MGGTDFEGGTPSKKLLQKQIGFKNWSFHILGIIQLVSGDILDWKNPINSKYLNSFWSFFLLFSYHFLKAVCPVMSVMWNTMSSAPSHSTKYNNTPKTHGLGPAFSWNSTEQSDTGRPYFVCGLFFFFLITHIVFKENIRRNLTWLLQEYPVWFDHDAFFFFFF